VAVPLDARQSGEWIEDPWIAADKAFRPCYIGGWSACEHWDFTEQTFRDVLVITARTLHPRHVVMQGIPFHLTRRPESALFGTVQVWRGQSKVSVSDPSRTLVDILDDPRLGGGIRHVASVVHEYFTSARRHDALIIQYGDRLGNRTVFKRLGYLVEELRIDASELVAACLQRRSTGLTALDPSVHERGRIVNRWRLRINASVGRPGGES
jgi:predicted transcriptional regulator of viral defense system